MAPDLDSVLRYFPPDAVASAGPCLVHETRSRDVATASRGTSRFHWVYVSTYLPSSASTIRGSSTPPGDSFVCCASRVGNSTGAGRRVKRSPSLLSARRVRDV